MACPMPSSDNLVFRGAQRMIYDISVPIHNSMHVWPTNPAVTLEHHTQRSASGTYSVRLTSIRMGSHTGTHMDAPCHFIEHGKTLDQIDPSCFVGSAHVMAFPGVPSIGLDQVAGQDWNGVQRVLFKTDNSNHWDDDRFFEDFVYLEPEAATFIADRGVQLVGIDYLSIDSFRSTNHPAHFILLGREIVLLEGLNLQAVRPGAYQLVALPLKIQNADGAPARAFLIDPADSLETP